MSPLVYFSSKDEDILESISRMFPEKHRGKDSSFVSGLGYRFFKRTFNLDSKDLVEINSFIKVYGFELSKDFYSLDKSTYWVEPIGMSD
jgi:hypothetical protein